MRFSYSYPTLHKQHPNKPDNNQETTLCNRERYENIFYRVDEGGFPFDH